MKKLNRGDFLLIKFNNKEYNSFIKNSGNYLTLVLFDSESEKLKQLGKVSESKLEYQIKPQQEMPEMLLKAYEECFKTIKKGSTVEFQVEGKTYTGVVTKGGTKLKVETEVNGEKRQSKGPAHAYKVKF